MISQSEQEVLQEICKNSKEALFDIHTLIGKVYDEELAMDLNRQAARYSRIQEKAANGLLETGVIPEPMSILDRTRRWAAIQANTALNVSTGHIADMVVKEKRNRMQSLEETVKENTVISAMSYELAEEFINFEEESLEKLKSYCKI